ncbi:formate dehydrogenase subunit gamma [Desulfitobacterium metallireducens]|uniref:Formate dehydrogenase n=1 Tax=Desulfitobacterium metallireducens DSM 15288 TaxID=871968 RepID=W0E4S3_9FIRM|nr:cytochrome b/b6 domain-containing protein [Desulfitobacterium metallireducens]AHF05860.1 formate dehydrogenase [Desulfitobacterium metallireducens DSM 15288]
MSIQTQTKGQFGQPAGTDKVLRFTLGERVSHWIHAVSFFLLLFTGLGILSLTIRPALAVIGGVQVARILHRTVAVLFVVGVGSMFFIGNPKYHWEWLRMVFHFTKADWQHVRVFPKEFFGGHGNYPAQDKYNGGEKINSLFTVFGSIFITLSGVVMWFPAVFPPALVRWAYPVHDLSMFMMTTAVIGHMYLGLLHPDSRVSLSGMLNGYVPSKFAKAHHAAWYERVKKGQN